MTHEEEVQWTERLARLYSGAVHDVMRGMGHDNCVLPTHLRPLDPALKVAGPVWTVSGRTDRTVTRHDSLLGWTTLLSKAPSGHVVVCQPHNLDVALMGELSAETLKNKGVLGYVVDGGCRDTDFILALGFPVFHTFFTPSDIVARWLPDHFELPVSIGPVTVRTYVAPPEGGEVTMEWFENAAEALGDKAISEVDSGGWFYVG
jgi:regulator of RNase E activity RraA